MQTTAIIWKILKMGGGRQTCAPNTYSCPHGGTPTTVTGDMRPSIHETISCSACDTDNGYHLEYVSGDSGPQTCAANAYSCPHGGTPTTVTGDMRPSMHEAISCSACDTDNGYHLEYVSGDSGPQTCAPNAYSCPHGGTPTTVTGDMRPSMHEAISCSACDTTNGYHLEYVSGDSGPQTCAANAYTCENGEEADNDRVRPSMHEMTENCGDCDSDSGYTLSDPNPDTNHRTCIRACGAGAGIPRRPSYHM